MAHRLTTNRGGGSVRLNPEGRINKNRKAKNKKPEGQIGRPNLTVRPKIQKGKLLPTISM